DGHRSHETTPMIDEALKHGIDLFSLVRKTTHKCQPLDVGIFGVVECRWGDKCDELADIGLSVTKDNVIPIYLEVRKEAMKPTNIVSAFRKTGIRPLN
ncbi:hypothetical protein C8F04DRAFT_904201, partial [Mycena alexandri]